MPTTKLVNEVPGKQRVKPITTIKTQQQLLAKDVFSHKITQFRRERLISLYTDETWSADKTDNLLNDAVVTCNINKHTTKNLTPIDASNHPEKVRYSISFKKIKPTLKAVDYVRNADKRNIFSKRYTSNWNRELVNVNQVKKNNT